MSHNELILPSPCPLPQAGASIKSAIMKIFIENGRSFFSRRETSIFRAASLIMATTAASRVLGLTRDRLLTSFFGASPELGVFWAAVEIPDTIFYILGSAVCSASLIPIFTGYLHREEKEKAWEMANSILKLSLIFFFLLATLIFVSSQTISRLVAPGFDQKQILLMSNLVRIMILPQFFFAISYLFAGVLNSFQRFLIPALAAVLYNLGVVLGILIMAPQYGIRGPAWGMVFGAVLHLLIQWPLVRSLGFSTKKLFKGQIFHPGTWRALRLALPRMIGLLGAKFSLLIQINLASLIPLLDSVSNVAVLTFARHLELLPIGLFGASISQAALPTLSMNSEDNEQSEFKRIFISALHQTLFLVAPTAIILLVLRIPMVRLVFGARRFTWKATVLTGYAVAFFSLGVTARALLYLFNRAFYALEEPKIPVKTSLAFSGLGIVLSWALTQIGDFGVWAIPLAFSISGILQATTLFIILDKRLGRFGRSTLLTPIAKIGWATLFSGAALYIPMKLLDKLVFDTTRTLGLLTLTGIAGLFGLSVYLFLTWIFGVRETKFLLKFTLSKLGIGK